MKKRSDRETRADDSREKIIGLGDSSARKSYYPQLQRRLRELKEEIVERQRVEDELRESQDLLRTVMNSAQDAMIAINEQALITTLMPPRKRCSEGAKRRSWAGPSIN